MKIGDLVIIRKENGTDTEQNVGQVAVVTYLFDNGKEIEIEIPSSNPGRHFFGTPWIYYKNQVEVIGNE